MCERAKRLAEMAADPAATIRETEKLATQRTTSSYRELAILLSDLREALAGSEQAGLAEKQAQKLKKKYPKLNRLSGELRGAGLLGKK